jgi:hypothetical protein
VQVLHPPQNFDRPPFLEWLTLRDLKNSIEVIFNGMASPLNFIKIYQLVQKLPGSTDRKVISLAYFFPFGREVGWRLGGCFWLGTRNVYKILLDKRLEKKASLKTEKVGGYHKMGRTDTGCKTGRWKELAQNSVKWRALICTVKHLWVLVPWTVQYRTKLNFWKTLHHRAVITIIINKVHRSIRNIGFLQVPSIFSCLWQ